MGGSIAQAFLDPDIVALAEHLFNALLGHLGPSQLAAIAGQDGDRHDLGAAYRLAGIGCHALAGQPGIDRSGGNLAGADRLDCRARSLLPVTAGEDTGDSGH